MRFALAAVAVVVVACAPQQEPADPSDDPADWDVDSAVDWVPVLSAPRFVVPGDALPRDQRPLLSNNNVAITFHEGSLFLAWRSAETHFASANAEMHVIRSDDGGVTWASEALFTLGSDVREPQLFTLGGELWLTFFQGGTNKFAFEPRSLWRAHRQGDGRWSDVEAWGREHEVPWDLKIRGGRALLTSYSGGHYDFTEQSSGLAVHLQTSDDGLSWNDVDDAIPDLYVGGASEAGFEIDDDGSLWALLRNEDGDGSGFGSLLCHSAGTSLSSWDCPTTSDPERYDSPKMLRHGDDLFVVARRDIGGPFDRGEAERDLADRRLDYNADYWNRPKRTSLYHVDKESQSLQHVLDLPSAGDTAFPSIRRTGAHSFLIANYTSPVDDPERTWVQGQDAVDGTSIYLIDLTFQEP